MSKRPTVCGVQVHTWGTSYGGGQGLWSHLKTSLYGGNVGHASMMLTIPANEKSKELINKYCIDKDGKTIIPHTLNKVKFANGAAEEVYEIYFSIWTYSEDNKLFFEKNLNNDRISALNLSNFDWGDKAKGIYDPHQKITTGLLGKQKILRGPLVIQHGNRAKISKQEYDVLLMLNKNRFIRDKLATLYKLKNKPQEKN